MCKQNSRRISVAIALAYLCSAAAPGFSQEATKGTAENWRPKDGAYAAAGATFRSRCSDNDDLDVDLKHHSISGNEWSCRITRLTDTAPGAIRLDMTCQDYNLALFINNKDPDAYERKFREVMLLRNIDGKSMSVRKTLNGKFKGSDWRASYCPESIQRMRREAEAKNSAEAERKAAEQRLAPKLWRPQDGVYATPGPDFQDRCLKSGDAIFELAEKSISSGQDRCTLVNIDDKPDAIQLNVICNQAPNTPGLVVRNVNGKRIFAPPGSETMVLRNIDGHTVFLQKTQNGNVVEPGGQLSYCSQDVQRKYARQKDKQ